MRVYSILRPSSRRNMKFLAEQKICVDIANFVRDSFLRGNLKSVCLHIPNESSTRKLTTSSSIKKEMLTVPGAADYVFTSKNKTIFLEVKTEKGTVTTNQKIFKEWCEMNEIPYYIVRSLKEAEKILKLEGMIS